MSLSVGTLNIWNRMGDWPTRLELIRKELRRLDLDVLALQEVIQMPGQFDQAAEVAEVFGYHVAYGRNGGGPNPMGNAILSRWPILRTHVFPLPRVETDEYRCLLYAEIDAPFGALPVFCTHLNWKMHEGHVREVQIRYVADQVQGLCPISGLPPILMGDFNAEPESDEIRFMRGHTSLGGKSVYFADAWGLVGEVPRGVRARDGGSVGATFSRRNPYAAVLREPNRRIDYVFVRGPDERGRGEVLKARVAFDTSTGDAFPSDHFGVVAEISTE